MAGEFSVEYDDVTLVAGQLTAVSDALAAAVRAAGDLQAVASPGFTSVDAALACAQAWLDEVERLAAVVDQARAQISDSVSTYQDTDGAAHGSFRSIIGGDAAPW